MKFTGYCVRAIVVVGFALFLIATFSAVVQMIDGSTRNLMESFHLIAEAGLMMGVGVIAEILVRK